MRSIRLGVVVVPRMVHAHMLLRNIFIELKELSPGPLVQ